MSDNDKPKPEDDRHTLTRKLGNIQKKDKKATIAQAEKGKKPKK